MTPMISSALITEQCRLGLVGLWTFRPRDSEVHSTSALGSGSHHVPDSLTAALTCTRPLRRLCPDELGVRYTTLGGVMSRVTFLALIYISPPRRGDFCGIQTTPATGRRCRCRKTPRSQMLWVCVGLSAGSFRLVGQVVLQPHLVDLRPLLLRPVDVSLFHLHYLSEQIDGRLIVHFVRQADAAVVGPHGR